MDMRLLVARNFKRVRLARGLSQQWVEELSGFSQQYLSGLERGTRNPTIISLFQIAEALDASVLDLLEGAPAARTSGAEEPSKSDRQRIGPPSKARNEEG